MRKGRWVKLYVREVGSFAQLPLYVRALAAELLKICDQDGRITLLGKQPWEAVAFQLGADLSDRRLLKKHIPVLIADGYLALRDGDLVVRNFAAAQDRHERDSNATETRARRDSNATETRLERESDTRTEVSAQKPPENDPSEKSRGEETREEKSVPLTRVVQVDTLAARRQTLSDIWNRHRDLYAALQADGIGKDARPLHPMDAGEREISNRLVEHKGDLASFRADCEHVLATRRQQALARGDLDWFGAQVWRRDNFVDALSRTPESYKRPANGRGPQKPRNFQVTGDEPYSDGDVEL